MDENVYSTVMEPDVQQCNVQFNAGVIFCHTEQDPTLLSCQGHGKEGLELADPFTLYSESKHISWEKD